MDYDLGANLDAFVKNIQDEIESDRKSTEDDEQAYTTKIQTKHTIKPLVLHVDKISVSQREEEIPGNYFPSSFWVEAHESYKKPVLSFHLPFTGDQQLFRCRPSSFLMWTEDALVTDNEIIFEIINFSNDAEAVKRDRDQFLKNLTEQVSNINKDIEGHNSKLGTVIKSSIAKAKQKFASHDDFLSKLGNNVRPDNE